MNRLLSRALVGCLLSCICSLALAVDYGRTEGSFGVSTGSATYKIPIWTPPGPNGIQPEISLSYDSQGGNGVAGVGWNLNAVTSIERCPRTIAQDNTDGAVNLTLNDRFCVSGNRLRLQSGTYGLTGSVYFTEIADFSRITAYGSQGNGPDHFIIEAKDGLLYEYGNVPTAKVLVVGTALRWMLNKVSDRNGNNYVITYNNLNGFAVPDVISWTPTSLGASTYSYQAKFNYLTTRADADSYIGYAFIYPISNRNRLASIQIKSAGVVKRKYVFAYDISTVTSRSRLLSAKECADDAELNCLLPITFSYQTGVAGLTAGAGTPPAGSSNSLIAGRYDFNGDGKQDIVYWSGSTWNVALSTNTGFSGAYGTSITGSVLVEKFLPSGRAALATVVSGVIWIYRWDDTTSAFVGSSTGITSALPTTSLDYNGDGLADLVYMGGSSLSVRANTTPGTGNPSFAASASSTAPLPANHVYANLYNYTGKGLFRADINGDGRQDLNVLIVSTGFGGGVTSSSILLGSSTGFDTPTAAQFITGAAPIWPAIDFNDDHCTDRMVNTTVMISSCNDMAATSVAAPAFPLALLDWDGDGRTDVLVDNGGNIGVYKSTGAGFSALITTSIPSAGTFFDLDLDGDGLDDLVRINGTSALSYWTHTSAGTVPTYATNLPDLLSNVLDGYGVSNTPNYVSTGSYNYDKGASIAWLKETGPAIVVALLTSSDGVGGTYNNSYFYVGSRTDATRGTFAGYQRIDSTDSRNGLITRAYYDQSFPNSNMLKKLEVMQPNGTDTIWKQDTSNTSWAVDPTPWNSRFFVYSASTTTNQYEVGGTFNTHLVRTVATTSTFDFTNGLLYDQTVTTTEPATGANGLAAGATWTTRTYFPPANTLNDPANWCSGRPGRREVTGSHSVPGFGTGITRTTSVDWDAVKCRPTRVTEEPLSGTLEVKNDIAYDSFGNLASTTVTGVGMTPRATSLVYADGTHTTGQFPLSISNALSQVSTTSWNYDLALPLSATDPNGLTTSWGYDAYGRRIRQTNPDATYTTWDYLHCTGCDARVYMYADQNDRRADGIAFSRSLQYFDQLERPVIGNRLRTDGNFNVTSVDFDAFGRVVHEYFPCKSTSSPVGYSTVAYDLVGRPTSIARPIDAGHPTTLQTTVIGYDGLTTRVTDPQGIWAFKTVQANGWLIRTTDRDSYFDQFDYDGFGNVVRVTDQVSNTFQTSTYNIRGMLTARTDMDRGSWTFTPNALGEVISQTDAKSQTTVFKFDDLGRLTKRTEAEGVSNFTYGISGANKNIGQLYSMDGPGYSETYSYDSFGRPSNTSISADTTYQIDYSYNSIGALDTVTYPTSTSSYRLKLQYEYLYGYLIDIKDFNSPSTVFWTANAFDARDHITQETLGNGLVTNRAYDDVTGWLKSIQTGPGVTTTVQNLSYEWDAVGNLKKRIDGNQSNLTEQFFYDNLYRLSSSSLSTTGTNLTMVYDVLGNITSKSDVGGYTYNASKKHQMTSTTNGWSFGYDSNGNMTSGRGATLTWTSYNYPASIANGSDTSSFSYTPDRQYWKQVSNYTSGGAGTTIYIGGLLEKTTTSTGTAYRHMIRAGSSTIIVSRPTVGSNTVNYVTSDHLGSSSAITDSSGGVLVNSSFGAFGARRGANWTGSPSAGDWAAIASTTRRGYTEHTMLDNLNLIHMNGRVYDPLLGRFISPDPLITEPLNTQGYNRYSYVQNNPLSAIDPSGFDKDILNRCEAAFCIPGLLSDSEDPRSTPCENGFGSHLTDAACDYINRLDGLPVMMSGAGAAAHDPLLTGVPPNSSEPVGAWNPNVMENRGRGGERGQAGKNPKPAKGIRPVYDGTGKVTGWIEVDNQTGKKSKPKSLDWGTQNGLNPADFEKKKKPAPGATTPGTPVSTPEKTPDGNPTPESGSSNTKYVAAGAILVVGAGRVACAIAEPCGIGAVVTGIGTGLRALFAVGAATEMVTQ